MIPQNVSPVIPTSIWTTQTWAATHVDYLILIAQFARTQLVQHVMRTLNLQMEIVWTHVTILNSALNAIILSLLSVLLAKQD